MNSENKIDLKKETKKGASWISIASLVSSLAQLILTMILSRYLDSSAFGVMAVALFVVNFSTIFVDIGISNVIIHKQDIGKKDLDSLFWLNVFMGLIIFIVINFFSTSIAFFYSDLELINVLRVISFVFLIQPFGAQFNVLLRKNLLFKSLAIRSICSQISALVIGVLLAYYGFGVYALVFSAIANTIVSTFLVVFAGIKFHKPGWYFSFNDIKGYLSFGLYQLGEKVMNFFNSDGDSLIIGKLVGVDSLGVYTIAKTFISKPYQVINPILTKIGFPLMARVQNDSFALQKYYKGIVQTLAYLNFPIHIFVFAFPELVVNIMFGASWTNAVIPLQILSLTYLLRSTMNPIGSLQLARGKANYGFYWNFIQFLFLPIIMFIGSKWGIIGICVGICAFQLVMFSVIGKTMVKKLCGLDVKEYYSIFVQPFFYCLLAYLITFSLSKIVSIDIVWIRFFVDGIVFCGSYIILVYKRERKLIEGLVK